MTRDRQCLAALALVVILLGLGCASKERIAKRIPKRTPAPAGDGYLKSAKPYAIMGVTYYPLADAYGYNRVGLASWYGKKFHGRPTASGETYNMRAMTAAHKTLPLQTMVEVTRLDTGKKIVVRVNDRGPFVDDRIIDLSYAAAQRLRMAERGTAHVRVVALAKGRPGPRGSPPVAEGPAPDFNHGRFWVQVGAFGVIENARRVRNRLSFPKSRIRFQRVVTVDGATLNRVQVGPYAEMRLADAALSSVKEQGFERSFIVAD